MSITCCVTMPASQLAEIRLQTSCRAGMEQKARLVKDLLLILKKAGWMV